MDAVCGKNITDGVFVMGRDPVELAKRAKHKTTCYAGEE